MTQIPDAPWIQEAERTGHYRFGWWNTPPRDDDDDADEVDDDGDEE